MNHPFVWLHLQPSLFHHDSWEQPRSRHQKVHCKQWDETVLTSSVPYNNDHNINNALSWYLYVLPTREQMKFFRNNIISKKTPLLFNNILHSFNHWFHQVMIDGLISSFIWWTLKVFIDSKTFYQMISWPTSNSIFSKPTCLVSSLVDIFCTDKIIEEGRSEVPQAQRSLLK